MKYYHILTLTNIREISTLLTFNIKKNYSSFNYNITTERLNSRIIHTNGVGVGFFVYA